MNLSRYTLLSGAMALFMAVAPAMVDSSPASASEIKYIVNNVPITSYDIQRRAAFIRLQRAKGNASEQMIAVARGRLEPAEAVAAGKVHADDPERLARFLETFPPRGA